MNRGISRTEQTWLAAGVYLVLALVVTWPWMLHPTDTLYGVVGGDQTASVAYFQQLVDAHRSPFLPGTLTDLNAPEGIEINWAVNLAGFGSAFVLWVSSLALGAVAAHGALAVLGFSISALAMFLLVRRLVDHSGIAFAVGLAFGFWAYTYPTGWTWPNYIHGWVFVLLAWRMLVAAERPSLRNGLLAGGAAVVAMTWIQYYLLIGAVAFAAMAAGALLNGWKRGNLRVQLQAQLVASGVVMAVVGTLTVLAASTGFEGTPVRPEGDTYLNSARPLMYLLPGPDHPLFGDSVGDWLVDKYRSPLVDPDSTAIFQAIYLGVPLMLLGLIGLIAIARRRAGGLAGIGVAAAWVALVGLLFSAPPKVGVLGFEVPMPYLLVNEVTTVFRAAARFSILVMLGLCVLAAVALASLLPRLRPTVQAVALGMITCAFAVDGWARPAKSTTRISHPAIYDVLARQPRGVVAEYPLNDAAISQNRESLHQALHGHRLFGGWDDGTSSAARKLSLRYLRNRRTTSVLAAFGVDYVVVHAKRGKLPTGLPPQGGAVPGLRQVGRAKGGTLYRVVARPPRFFTATAAGFAPPEGPPPGVQWTHRNGAVLELRGRCSPCAGTMVLSTGTFARGRNLTITDPSGRVVLRELIGSSFVRLRVPVRFSGRTTLRFETDPPPDRIDDFLHNGDSRSFGVFVGWPVRFVASMRDGHRWTA